jgi:Flp pilus assembly pilin Flp
MISNIKNVVRNFINDERGAESSECGVTNVLFAGGAVAGGKQFRDTIKEKQQQVIDELGTVDVG